MAWALGVGRLSLETKDGRQVLAVATRGKAQPTLETLKDRLVITIPGGDRKLSTLRIGSDPIRQIRFGKSGKNLRVVLDLSREVQASLGAASASGFTLDLGPAAAGAAPAAAEAAAEPDEALNPAKAGYTYSVVDIALGGDAEHSELLISANGPASYKPSIRDGGREITLIFRNTSLSYSGALDKLKDDSIESVSAKEISAGGETQVKVDVRLAKKLDYALKRDQNQVLLRLQRPEERVEAPKRGDMETSVSIDVQNADLVGVVKTLAEQAGFEYQFTKDILSKTPPDSLVTAKVQKRPFREVLDTLLAQVGAKVLRQGNTLFIGSETETNARRARLPAVTRTYSPRYLNYDQLLAIMKLQYAFDAAGAARVDSGIKPDPRDKSRMMLIGTQDEVSSWLDTIARFDVPESGEEAASADGEGGSGGSIKTQIFHLQYLLDNSFLDSAIKQLYPEGETPAKTNFDPTTRTLVVTAQMKYLKKIEKLISRLDVKRHQVNIEARVVELNQGVRDQLGIDWKANKPSTATQETTALAVNGSTALTLGMIRNGFDIVGTISALVAETKAEVLSAPNITVQDNTDADINVGDTIAYTVQDTLVSNGVPIIVNRPATQSFPLDLKVKPYISMSDRRVRLTVNFALTTQTGTQVGSAAAPTSVQSATTEVTVDSGETLAIGGLIRQNLNSSDTKTPILGDIPLLGMLFKSHTQDNQKKDLMILITPSIIED
jgi:type II secretory pathway component GspD/PulD (secretin)